MVDNEYLPIDAVYDMSTLSDWYQASIDNTEPPIWTDEHLEELIKDFYIFPKDTPRIKAKPIVYAHWIRKEENSSQCSNCNSGIPLFGLLPFCPYCGAEIKNEMGNPATE